VGCYLFGCWELSGSFEFLHGCVSWFLVEVWSDAVWCCSRVSFVVIAWHLYIVPDFVLCCCGHSQKIGIGFVSLYKGWCCRLLCGNLSSSSFVTGGTLYSCVVIKIFIHSFFFVKKKTARMFSDSFFLMYYCIGMQQSDQNHVSVENFWENTFCCS
jgi:hypothetical protein